MQASIKVPLLHIADATADAIRTQGLHTVGLLGTRFTMEQSFYVDHMAERGVTCLVPDKAEREEVHRIIFEELCRGHVLPSSRQTLQDMCSRLCAQGAQGIVLGCTELPLILSEEDLPVPIFDTTRLHALAAVEFALA